ncbi:MAG: hypothetical protein EXS09_06225 [Gemmataceae bacterium]|nr:hypothetical protein [Gemmataceae bacterium]
MATSDSHGEFKPLGPTHGMAYEPDKFSVKPILAVPAVVIGTAALAFVITWILFANIFDPRTPGDPPENREAAERNSAPMNERFARISSTDPKAEVQQPRLEGLMLTEQTKREGQYTITAEMTTQKVTKEGNSPRYHAEDLRPEKIAALQAKDKDRMPIDQAIEALLSGGHLKARAGATPLDLNANWDRPKESNGGTGKIPEAPKLPANAKE